MDILALFNLSEAMAKVDEKNANINITLANKRRSIREVKLMPKEICSNILNVCVTSVLSRTHTHIYIYVYTYILIFAKDKENMQQKEEKRNGSELHEIQIVWSKVDGIGKVQRKRVRNAVE